jgi:hypothetical protein
VTKGQTLPETSRVWLAGLVALAGGDAAEPHKPGAACATDPDAEVATADATAVSVVLNWLLALQREMGFPSLGHERDLKALMVDITPALWRVRSELKRELSGELKRELSGELKRELSGACCEVHPPERVGLLRPVHSLSRVQSALAEAAWCDGAHWLRRTFNRDSLLVAVDFAVPTRPPRGFREHRPSARTAWPFWWRQHPITFVCLWRGRRYSLFELRTLLERETLEWSLPWLDEVIRLCGAWEGGGGDDICEKGASLFQFPRCLQAQQEMKFWLLQAEARCAGRRPFGLHLMRERLQKQGISSALAGVLAGMNSAAFAELPRWQAAIDSSLQGVPAARCPAAEYSAARPVLGCRSTQ